MAKNSIRDYDATAANNTDVQSTDISEGCAASGINNAIREVMADLKDVSTGTVALETPSADQLNVDNLRLDGNTISSTDTNGNLTLDPDGTGDTIVASGNLGIGTASVGSSTKVQAAGRGLFTDGLPDPADGSPAGIAVGYNTSSGYAFVQGIHTGVATKDLYLQPTGSSNLIACQSGGGLVVGGTTGDSYSGVPAANTMYGPAGSGAYALGLTQNTTSAGGGRVLGLRNVTDFNNTGNEIINYNGNTTQRFVVVSNGNVYNTNNTYGAISDQKLKEQITDASSQWDDIKALTVRKYKMKDEVLAQGESNAVWKLGVVAQELETAGMAGLVDERIDRDEDGNDAGTTTKSVKYSVLYMKAIKALQEAMDRIETLETENSTQATQIADLITRVTALENA